MVNGPKKVYVEKQGLLTKTNIVFDDNEHVQHIIDRIILPLGRRVDADSPMVDARLPDGSRVNAIIPPVAIDGPSITIRKFSKDKLSISQLIHYSSITAGMAEFLRACVIGRLNILISGGTGSGKTTLLNVLSSFIPEEERIITIEDAAELRLQQDHVVRLETKVANVEDRGTVSVRDLVRNSLRMRPDRIVVGEVRGGEALDMLQAMNTGHDGSLTTIHANSPRDAISRLETLVLMAGMELPIKIVRQQVSSAIDVIIQQARLRDGTRKVVAITEVAGMEGDVVVLSDIFKFEQTGIDGDGKVLGQLKPTGIRPLFGPRLEVAGFKLSAEIFGGSAADILAANRQRR
jgi:pilus assembly protein CpaF